MSAVVVKRSVIINGHNTSISLEEPFWLALKSIAADRQVTLAALVSSLDENREAGNLSSGIRVFVLAHAQAAGLSKAA